MKWNFPILASLLLAASALYAQSQQTAFVGIITDTMCGVNHKLMGSTPPAQCTVQCVKSNPEKIKYALVEGDNVYVLSDQRMPEKFAGQKVKVTGTLKAKTKTIEVKLIERGQ